MIIRALPISTQTRRWRSCHAVRLISPLYARGCTGRRAATPHPVYQSHLGHLDGLAVSITFDDGGVAGKKIAAFQSVDTIVGYVALSSLRRREHDHSQPPPPAAEPLSALRGLVV